MRNTTLSHDVPKALYAGYVVTCMCERLTCAPPIPKRVSGVAPAAVGCAGRVWIVRGWMESVGDCDAPVSFGLLGLAWALPEMTSVRIIVGGAQERRRRLRNWARLHGYQGMEALIVMNFGGKPSSPGLLCFLCLSTR